MTMSVLVSSSFSEQLKVWPNITTREQHIHSDDVYTAGASGFLL